jgi:superfamily II DNA or RNA helicase
MIDYELLDFQKEHFKNLKTQYYWCGTGVGKTYMALDRLIKLGVKSGILVIAPKQKIDSGDWQELELPNDTIFINNHYTNIKKVYDKKTVIKHIVIDEAHLVKNFKTKSWQYLEKIIDKYKPGTTWLSATPTSNGLFDYYPFLSTLLRVDFNKDVSTAALDKTVSIYERQKFNYCDYPIKVLVGYKNEALFKKMIKNSSFIKLSMPKEYSIRTEIIKFNTPAGYSKTKKLGVFKDEVVDTPMKMWNILRSFENREKINFIKNLEHKNIVIFTNYKAEVEYLKNNLENCGVIDGSNKIDLKQKEKYKHLIVNYKSGSAALNLQHATCCIHYSPSCNYTDHVQSLGRIDRVGQTANAIEIFTFCQSDIDKKIIEALKQKKDFNYTAFIEKEL